MRHRIQGHPFFYLSYIPEKIPPSYPLTPKKKKKMSDKKGIEKGRTVGRALIGSLLPAPSSQLRG